MKQLLLAGTAFLALAASSSTAKADPIVFDFPYTGSLVTFTVPTTDTYQILAFGAQGGGSGNVFGRIGQTGRGAAIGGNFNLTAGEVLQIAVGGAGVSSGVCPSRFSGGGGGGSFVVGPGNTPLVIAGGGGGGASPGGGGGGGLTTPNGGGFGGGINGSGGNGGPLISGGGGGGAAFLATEGMQSIPMPPAVVAGSRLYSAVLVSPRPVFAASAVASVEAEAVLLLAVAAAVIAAGAVAAAAAR